ncbi:membrane protein insertase YidC [Candidatus Riesia pediculicola]|uniref:Membrane protein insertase YidC n=1 Tax=Riesia pediculicola (strain USDA) TaxID=515618 RepID=D4G7W6_RIEPU|nr:membrane protein insertase YidC [Candidatus Riesia pediculicola]ADD79873.1 inner membrane protein OxaA [Candidatus Riesia pediculicola USDA]ARC53682.1 insertase [Candidatus Riesia pediculicola]QOJ86328.1 membrane protein insertase YidC [Candidatus Riesia pediculicola]
MYLQKNLLFIALLFFSSLIWQIWKNDKVQEKTLINAESNDIPLDRSSKYQIQKGEYNSFIKVKTNVFEILLDKKGGDIHRVDLIQYKKKLNSDEPFRIIDTKEDFVYQVQSGFIGKNGPDNISYNNGIRPTYSSRRDYFIIDNEKEYIKVPLIFVSKNNVIYEKIYVFKRDQYDIEVEYRITNNSAENIEISIFGQLKQNVEESYDNRLENRNFSVRSYRGAAYSSDQTKYKKCTFKDLMKKKLEIHTKSGWIAMLQQYFASAWILNDQYINSVYSINFQGKSAIIGYRTPKILIKSNERFQYISKLWIGPELQTEMSKVANYLDLTVDYGWLWFISQPLFQLLQFIYRFVGNWGFSIVIITFIVRGLMYPLTKAQYISMAKIRLLQPKLEEIKNRIGEDKNKMSQEVVELYRKEKVNPLGGCLPLIIQMPIFLALYYMLIGSVELRQAPFIYWIQDLSSKDPYYFLPLLMGCTMYFIQKMSPNTNTSELSREKIINYIPIFFTIFFLWFPSGLVLYYIISNLVTIIQQKAIYRFLKKKGLRKFDKN